MSWKSASLLRSVRELRPQGKSLSLKLTSLTDPANHNFSGQKPLQAPVLGEGKLNCNWQIAGDSEWTSLRVKNSRWGWIMGARGHPCWWVLPPGALPGSHCEDQRKICSCFSRKRSVPFCLTRSAFRRNYLIRPSPAGVLSEPNRLGGREIPNCSPL